jgi:hypothetical protein
MCSYVDHRNPQYVPNIRDRHTLTYQIQTDVSDQLNFGKVIAVVLNRDQWNSRTFTLTWGEQRPPMSFSVNAPVKMPISTEVQLDELPSPADMLSRLRLAGLRLSNATPTTQQTASVHNLIGIVTHIWDTKLDDPGRRLRVRFGPNEWVYLSLKHDSLLVAPSEDEFRDMPPTPRAIITCATVKPTRAVNTVMPQGLVAFTTDVNAFSKIRAYLTDFVSSASPLASPIRPKVELSNVKLDFR